MQRKKAMLNLAIKANFSNVFPENPHNILKSLLDVEYLRNNLVVDMRRGISAKNKILQESLTFPMPKSLELPLDPSYAAIIRRTIKINVICAYSLFLAIGIAFACFLLLH